MEKNTRLDETWSLRGCLVEWEDEEGWPLGTGTIPLDKVENALSGKDNNVEGVPSECTHCGTPLTPSRLAIEDLDLLFEIQWDMVDM